nr:MAG TPA: holin [Bacteriophage sp.]
MVHIDANNLKNIVLAACAAVGSYVANALGGWDSALKLLIALMAADYITGFLLAMIWHRSNKSPTGALSSKAGFKGICKKGAILLMVWVAVMLDGAIGSEYVRVAVILFFVGNEGLSLLENLGLMGVPYPSFLQRALEALRSKGDQGDKDTEM